MLQHAITDKKKKKERDLKKTQNEHIKELQKMNDSSENIEFLRGETTTTANLKL